MTEQFPFFNFSLKKVVASEPDSFKKAKIKIVFTILLLSLLKVLIVVPAAILYGQNRQLIRAIFNSFIFLALIKLLLYRPSRIKIISHLLLVAGLSVVWSNFYLYSQDLNTITVQLVLMTILISYYLLGGVQAAVYTFLSVLPVFLYIVARELDLWQLNIRPEHLAAPAFDLIVLLNFVTMVISHYLYYKAFHQNLREKEILNKQLEVNIREAKALADSRSFFLSTMSHELRTPLNGVIGMTHLLKDMAIKEQSDYLNILEFSATNLMSMINDVLDYNKSELDKIELEAIPVNLAILLQKIGSGLQMKAAEKTLGWEMKPDEKLKRQFVITDPTRLTQIIYNLAGNAIKFTDHGMVSVKATVLDQDMENITVRFCISDTGIGIAPDRQQAIFDPFTQASKDTTRKYGGTGLGLAIVKRLLSLFGSEIQLESQPGRGSVFKFSICFPLYREVPESGSRISLEKTGMSGLKLLVAEDNQINVLLLEKLLSKWEIQVIVAKNGQEALQQVLTTSFDAILMDIHMPVMDGFETTLAIRSLSDPAKANIPIIAITASVSHNILAKIMEVGIQDYLPKPFQTDQLYEKLQHLHMSVKLQ